MTVISLLWNLHLALTAGNRCQQVTSVVRRISLVRQALRLHIVSYTNWTDNCTAITCTCRYFVFYI